MFVREGWKWKSFLSHPEVKRKDDEKDCNKQPDPCGHAHIVILIYVNTCLLHFLIRDKEIRILERGQ